MGHMTREHSLTDSHQGEGRDEEGSAVCHQAGRKLLEFGFRMGKKAFQAAERDGQLPERDVSCQQNLKRCDAYMAECGDERSVGSRRTS
jgi:hypothetical protein